MITDMQIRRSLRRVFRLPWVLAVLVSVLIFVLAFRYLSPSTFAERKDFIQLAAQILGGSLLIAGLYFTWRRIEIAKEEQITERFTRAIDQLGSEKLEIRLGGIYALERIARDSKRDHWTIMEVLMAFVKANSPNHLDSDSAKIDRERYSSRNKCNRTARE